MKKNTLHKLYALLLVLSLVLGLSATALAANASVTYEGGAEKFVFLPGSDYSSSDLFESFKGAMPGDSLTQLITVKNDYGGADRVKIYIRALPHDAQMNTPHPDVAADVGLMNEFLSQLTMKVWNGTTLIFDGHPAEADGLLNNVLLGTFTYGQSTTLTVELDVPIELDNTYANCAGEVDWMFVAEEYEDSDIDPWPTPTPTYRPVFLGPRTGDGANTGLWIALLASGAVVILLTALVGRKKRKGANRR